MTEVRDDEYLDIDDINAQDVNEINVGEAQESAPIDDEIAQTMKATGAVVVALEHMRDLISKNEKVQDPEALMKIIRPMSMNIENSLPSLHDFIDNLETVGESDKAVEVRRQMERIEDELLPVVLKYIDTHTKLNG